MNTNAITKTGSVTVASVSIKLVDKFIDTHASARASTLELGDALIADHAHGFFDSIDITMRRLYEKGTAAVQAKRTSGAALRKHEQTPRSYCDYLRGVLSKHLKENGLQLETTDRQVKWTSDERYTLPAVKFLLIAKKERASAPKQVKGKTAPSGKKVSVRTAVEGVKGKGHVDGLLSQIVAMIDTTEGWSIDRVIEGLRAEQTKRNAAKSGSTETK